ncbi:MAG: iron ABC transporter permease [Lachnospiraceae bacterium]|nr:iron ABC transporter permease [Lachnospiraceae bacterium]
MSKKAIRFTVGYLMLIVLLGTFIVLNLNIGSSNIPLKKVIDIVLTHNTTTIAGKIIWNIRIPRLIAAMLLGGALTVSGFLLQTFFSNPIAGPYVLGISSGAKLVVALTMVFCLDNAIVMTSTSLIIAAFAGSLISMGFVILISGKVKRMSVLIVCGVMIGYICSSITEFVVTFADDSNIVNLHNWSMGSFSGISMDNVNIILIITVIGIGLAFLMSKPISAYQLGEEYAQNMGVNIKVFRIQLVLLSSILSAVVTAFAGPISFVGIAVPHLMRRMFKTNKPIHMIPVCFLGGAAFCLLCDLIARCLLAPTELSISSVTAVFGAPIVIYMMITRKK